MAVINCPSCNKKISDKAKSCSHCQLSLTDLDEEKISTINKISVVQKSQTLMNHSFIAMLLFCGGFLFMYWNNAAPESWQYISSITSTVVGFILYLVTRVRLIMLKHSQKN